MDSAIGDNVIVGVVGGSCRTGDTGAGVDVTTDVDTVPVGGDGGEPSSNMNWLFSRDCTHMEHNNVNIANSELLLYVQM